MPTAGVGVGGYARVKLGQLKQASAVFEHLVAGARAMHRGVHNLVGPVDIKDELLAWRERLGQVHAHRGVDGVRLEGIPSASSTRESCRSASKVVRPNRLANPR